MAQYKKDEINKIILAVAKNEFLEKGFAHFSMREIAKKSGVSVSNIYNYFSNKDLLFENIVKDVYEEIVRLNHAEVYSTYFTRLMSYEDDLEKAVNQLMQYVRKNKEVLSLLLTKSAGSKYVCFRI